MSAELLSSRTASQLSPIEWADGDLLVMVSQDCDVLHDDELVVELIRAEPCKSPPNDRNKLYGRSIRELYLPNSSSSGFLRFQVNDRVWVSRADLVEIKPRFFLEQKLIMRIASWLSFRYKRAAFPDCFNETLSKAESTLRKKLGKLTEEKAEALIGVYLDVHPDGGLGESECYIAEMLVLVDGSASTTALDRLGIIFKAFVKAAADAGVELRPYDGESFLVCDDSVTVADIRVLKRWHMEELSIKTKGGSSETLRGL